MNTPPIRDYRDASVGLAGWRKQLQELHAAFVALADELDAEQFDWQPAPEKWSIGLVVEHLNTTNHELLGPLQRAVADARARGVKGAPPFKYGWLGRWFLDELAPPVKRPAHTPAKYVPEKRGDFAKDAVLAEYGRQHEELLKLLADSEGVHLGRVQVRSPALWLLRLPVGIWLASIPAHGARHLLQARAVREQVGFPRR